MNNIIAALVIMTLPMQLNAAKTKETQPTSILQLLDAIKEGCKRLDGIEQELIVEKKACDDKANHIEQLKAITEPLEEQLALVMPEGLKALPIPQNSPINNQFNKVSNNLKIVQTALQQALKALLVAIEADPSRATLATNSLLELELAQMDNPEAYTTWFSRDSFDYAFKLICQAYGSAKVEKLPEAFLESLQLSNKSLKAAYQARGLRAPSLARMLETFLNRAIDDLFEHITDLKKCSLEIAQLESRKAQLLKEMADKPVPSNSKTGTHKK